MVVLLLLLLSVTGELLLLLLLPLLLLLLSVGEDEELGASCSLSLCCDGLLVLFWLGMGGGDREAGNLDGEERN